MRIRAVRRYHNERESNASGYYSRHERDYRRHCRLNLDCRRHNLHIALPQRRDNLKRLTAADRGFIYRTGLILPNAVVCRTPQITTQLHTQLSLRRIP